MSVASTQPAVGARVYWNGTWRTVKAVQENGRTRDGEDAVLVQLLEDGKKKPQPWTEWWRVEKFAYSVHAPTNGKGPGTTHQG